MTILPPRARRPSPTGTSPRTTIPPSQSALWLLAAALLLVLLSACTIYRDLKEAAEYGRQTARSAAQAAKETKGWVTTYGPPIGAGLVGLLGAAVAAKKGAKVLRDRRSRKTPNGT